MERAEAIERLHDLEGQNLHDLAAKHGITVVGADGRENKGWAGHALERHLELPINSSQSPDFGTWELKQVPLKYLRNGQLAFKETMAVTMIDPVDVLQKEFEDSHLLAKLREAIIVSRIVGTHFSQPSYIYTVTPINLCGHIYDVVKQDYELVRAALADPSRGFDSLTGHMGALIQPRTKGQRGKAKKTRAFYARKEFLSHYIKINN